jgi:cytoskeleton protein RodZ
MPVSMSKNHHQLDLADSLMREVGAQLRQVRLDRGQDLDEVGQHLRIKASYLAGIEQGDLSAMPGRTYALGFLRTYADYLGFDGDELVTQIKSTVANLTDRTRLRVRTPMPESRLPKTPVLVLSLAAVAAIYAGWSYLNRGGQAVIDTVAEVPASLRDLAAGAFGDGAGGGAPPPADAARGSPPSPGTDATADGPRSAVTRGAALPAAGPGPDAAGSRDAAPDPLATTEDPAPDRMAAAPPAETPSASAPASPAPTSTPDGAGGPVTPPQAATPEPSTEAGRVVAMARPDAPEPAPSMTPPASEAPSDAVSPVSGPGAPATDATPAGQDRLAALPLDPAVIGPVGWIGEPENRDARVVLRATASSWIQISSPSGDYVRARTLEPNDVFLVPNRADLELWTGNAGGLQVIVDGRILAPLGTSGAVIRKVSLEPSSLRARLGPPPQR